MVGDMSTDDDDSNGLGQWLREQREAKGLSIRAAARAAGFSEGRWRQLESGHELRQGARIPVNPKPSTVVQAADAVGLDARFALELAGMSTADIYDIRDDELHELTSAVDTIIKALESGMRPQDRQIEIVIQQSRAFLTAVNKEKPMGIVRPLAPFEKKVDYLEELRYRVDQPDAWHPKDGPRHKVAEKRARLERQLRLDEFSQPITATGSATAPAALVTGQGTISGPSFADRIAGLDRDGLVRLRDFIDGALYRWHQPELDERVARVAMEMADTASRLYDLQQEQDAIRAEITKVQAQDAQDELESLRMRSREMEMRIAQEESNLMMRRMDYQHVMEVQAEAAAKAEKYAEGMANAERGETPER